MLDPHTDRLDYGSLLAPPEDYRLDFATGCTYSLDLDALICASMALGLGEESDSELIKNPLCILNALRRTGDKMLLFCQAGQIHLPKKENRLHMLLENIVAEVMLDKKGRYPSFHPKMWLIRYKNESGKALYRFIVLSRNLTFDQSWDVALCLEGEKKSRRCSQTKPLADFVNYLKGYVPAGEEYKEKRKALKILAEEIENVKFRCKDGLNFDFVPTGIDGYSAEETVLKGTGYDEIEVVSPFLSKTTVRELCKKLNRGRLTLVTREMSLEVLGEELLENVDAYVLSDVLFDGESDEGGCHRELHAKMYLSKKDGKRELYAGSLNASKNAFENNVELGIKLYGNALTKEEVFGGFLYGENVPVERALKIKKGEEEKNNNLNEALRRFISESKMRAVVTENNGLYDVTVSFKKSDFKENIFICPLFIKAGYKAIADVVVFEGMELIQLSSFYKVKITDEDGNSTEKIIIIPTEGIPDDRDKAVLKVEIGKESDNFFRYIMYLLGDDMAAVGAEIMQNEAYAEKGKDGKVKGIVPSLYEKMLRIAAAEPDKLKEIEFLLEALKDDAVVPEEFKALYGVFERAVSGNGRKRKQKN